MSVTVDNVAKISLTLDTANIFKQIENIQEKLNKLSVKNIKASRGEQVFDGMVKGAKKAKEEAKTLQQAVREAENAYSKAYYKNSTNMLWQQSEEAKKLVENIRIAKTALIDFNNVRKAIDESITGKQAGKVQDKDYQRQQREALEQAKQNKRELEKLAKQEAQEKQRVERKKAKELARIQKEQVRQAKELAQQEVKINKEKQKELKRLAKQQDKLDSRSITQQIRDLKKEMSVNYAKNPNYLNSFELELDINKLQRLISLENEYQKRVSNRPKKLNDLSDAFTYQEEISRRRKDIQNKMRTISNYYGSDEYKTDIANVQKLQTEYDKLKADLKGVVEKKQEVNKTKIKSDDVDNYSKRIKQLKNDLEKKSLNNKDYIDSEDYKKKIAEIKELQTAYDKLRTDIKGVTKQASGFKNYQTEMDKIAKEAAKVFHKLNSNDIQTGEYAKLQKKLHELSTEYQRLNKESVKFRKAIGISSSRGFYDLNSTYDYFLAKFRSKVTAGIAGTVENYAMNAIPNFVEAMSNYQQNRVNFAQVLPDDLANNQKIMNDAMRDFTKIASDYGASVQEVTEAGRLWGRQYKDISIIQELVRNSTKLSITDNMSLIEVNKGLEATMQQYNVHLKDANEAQQASGKIVDTWAKLADNAVVTASDLAKANERSAGAAYNAGIGFDYLNAMIATMSSATGKAGGEIGNSIRSMIVSMQTGKAQKYLKEMNIATKELGEDGTLKMRSYEKVITEVMQKIKNSPKDYSDAINAFSGGKFQYNNVMALLKNYDNMQKNLQTSKTSAGWADEQVGLQYETISRQLKALNADFQQLIITLDKAGASSVIGDFISILRTITQLFASLNPAIIETVGSMVKLIAITKGMVTFLPYIKMLFLGFTECFAVMRSGTTIINAVATNTIKLGNAFKMLSMATGYIGIAIVALTTLYGLYDSYSQKQKELADLESVVTNKTEQNIVAYQSKAKQISELNDIIQNNQSIIEDNTKSELEHEKANQKLMTAKKQLIELLPKEAQEKVLASNYSKKAIDNEAKAVAYLAKVEYEKAVKGINLQIKQSKAVIEQTNVRIKAYEAEINALEARNNMLLVAEKVANDNGGYSSGNIISGEQNYTSEMLKSLKDELEKAKQEREKNLQKLKSAEQQLKDINNPSWFKNSIIGSTGGEVEDIDEDKGKSKSTGSNVNNAEQLQRNVLQARRNELWYEGSIQAKKYENSLKDITNDEQYYGTTVASIIAKSSLYGERSKELEDYKAKLEKFRADLENELEAKMKASPQLAQLAKYTIGLKGEELEKNIEVNKEVYQQSKTVSNIINLISAVNQKLEETKTKSIDIANEQRKIADEISKQKISDIEQQASIDIARINRPTNFDYSKQKNQIELEAERAKLKQYEEDLRKTQDLINNISDKDNAKDIADLYKRQQTEIKIVEETKAKVAELENEKTATIRQGLYDVTQQFLIQGNSLKDIWNNLWKDLAREALQRLFQIQAQASILGSLFGWSGGGKTATVTAGNYNFGKSFGYSDFKISHTGENLSGYPKMHTGGMVQQGRLGVVPEIKSDEVIRTLQVGEEVNSVSDRRSNEILATVAMKAIDSRNQQPNNINIMAIDSRSFAEYLNDNADVLLAVLNKQGALGRR